MGTVKDYPVAGIFLVRNQVVQQNEEIMGPCVGVVEQVIGLAGAVRGPEKVAPALYEDILDSIELAALRVNIRLEHENRAGRMKVVMARDQKSGVRYRMPGHRR
jgi:hypothetical protein